MSRRTPGLVPAQVVGKNPDEFLENTQRERDNGRAAPRLAKAAMDPALEAEPLVAVLGAWVGREALRWLWGLATRALGLAAQSRACLEVPPVRTGASWERHRWWGRQIPAAASAAGAVKTAPAAWVVAAAVRVAAVAARIQGSPPVGFAAKAAPEKKALGIPCPVVRPRVVQKREAQVEGTPPAHKKAAGEVAHRLAAGPLAHRERAAPVVQSAPDKGRFRSLAARAPGAAEQAGSKEPVAPAACWDQRERRCHRAAGSHRVKDIHTRGARAESAAQRDSQAPSHRKDKEAEFGPGVGRQGVAFRFCHKA